MVFASYFEENTIDDRVAESLRHKTPAERMAMISEAYDTGRLLAAAGIRHFHPDWSNERVAQATNERMLGESS